MRARLPASSLTFQTLSRPRFRPSSPAGPMGRMALIRLVAESTRAIEFGLPHNGTQRLPKPAAPNLRRVRRAWKRPRLFIALGIDAVNRRRFRTCNPDCILRDLHPSVCVFTDLEYGLGLEEYERNLNFLDSGRHNPPADIGVLRGSSLRRKHRGNPHEAGFPEQSANRTSRAHWDTFP